MTRHNDSATERLWGQRWCASVRLRSSPSRASVARLTPGTARALSKARAPAPCVLPRWWVCMVHLDLVIRAYMDMKWYEYKSICVEKKSVIDGDTCLVGSGFGCLFAGWESHWTLESSKKAFQKGANLKKNIIFQAHWKMVDPIGQHHLLAGAVKNPHNSGYVQRIYCLEDHQQVEVKGKWLLLGGHGSLYSLLNGLTPPRFLDVTLILFPPTKMYSTPKTKTWEKAIHHHLHLLTFTPPYFPQDCPFPTFYGPNSKVTVPFPSAFHLRQVTILGVNVHGGGDVSKTWGKT